MLMGVCASGKANNFMYGFVFSIDFSNGKEYEKCVVHVTNKYHELFNSLFSWRSLHLFRKLFVQDTPSVESFVYPLQASSNLKGSLQVEYHQSI